MEDASQKILATTPDDDKVRQNADYQVLLQAISSCAGIAIQQLLKLDPSLVHIKGWHGQTPLHRACLTGDVSVVRLLLESGADPNATNEFDETPVHYASKRGVPSLVHVLAQFGGKLDIKDQKQRTPLHDAAQTGSVFMLQYFAEQGFGFRDLDENLQSPLHFACSFGHLDAFKYLMRKDRSDPAQQDRDGNTPLHVCAREGYGHGSWLLLNQLGLQALHEKNREGYTPLDLCRQQDSKNKAGIKVLLPVLEDLGRKNTTARIRGPLVNWYYLLLMPTIVYAFSLLVATFILPEYQGIAVVPGLVYIALYSRTANHRLTHVSRWASPLFIGLFSAGVFHTMAVYYFHISYYLAEYRLLLLMSVVLNAFQLYLYWKLLIQDAGEVRSGQTDKKTGRDVTVTDLCASGEKLDNFCVTCEFVKSGDTKHCRLCDKCYYQMDHHCLFLLKCVAHNNHARFVWFIIISVAIIIIFLMEVAFYINLRYGNLTYKHIFGQMFWTNAWVLSMAVLNLGSIVWAIGLLRFQLTVISKAQTTYFQHHVSFLTPAERLLNVLYFLQGKPPFATGFDFEPAKSLTTDNTSIHATEAHMHNV